MEHNHSGPFMILTSRIYAITLALLAMSAGGFAQAGQPPAVCNEATFAASVDKFGASLRGYNAEAQPRMRARLTALAEKKGWMGEDREERAMLYLEDGRLGELDTRANDLLSKVDQLGRSNPDGSYDCSKLAEIEAASIEMLAVMKTKAAYLDDKVEREVGSGKSDAPKTAEAKPSNAKAAAAPPPVAPDIKSKSDPAPPKDAAAPAKVAPGSTKLSAAPPARPEPSKTAPPSPPSPSEPDGVWSSKTKSVLPPPGGPAGAGASVATAPAGPAGEPTLPPVTFETAEQGYTIDEIRDATRGFFGTVSTNLASVIEYTFANSGRPTGYILGTEGGGAFLAGLRYGKGTLYLREGGTRPIHWHGPSVGYDIGAEGGRTLILVYKMRDPDQLYRSFTGIDGSAYLVGGVGMTLLKGGDVIMAPIRSGIGLRLGANIGYLRFTAQPTWNPF
jgi:hypothetical protein